MSGSTVMFVLSLEFPEVTEEVAARLCVVALREVIEVLGDCGYYLDTVVGFEDIGTDPHGQRYGLHPGPAG
ncbi:hypothetical protein DQP55_24325 [Mycolicibacterium sp. GF69]|uniref:hypothetical protein n=1 Tax=Mycolicibacterium sp. GF69 TaxID=2267251 RepID=UPI000DCECAA7|nr:hypothetical protein [Mycolicibacterium sp. GF69]RAV06134.1 hypothetical protein DQP55_24325 [Mycolicibacterium sp. GF69]